jgi:hypothetical protein
MNRLVLLALAGSLVVGCRPAETSHVEPPSPAPAVAPAAAPVGVAAPPTLDRVVTIGASATFGFGTRVVDDTASPIRAAPTTFAEVLDASIVRDRTEPVAGRGNLGFFGAPMRIGPVLVDEALAREPTLVVGIDFLFWFAYGMRAADGGMIRDGDMRLALLEEGLRLLERFECPVVVGDLPDMSPAIGLMLSAAQVPDPATLDLLNRRIDGWSRERRRVVVVPMSTLVTDARQGADLVIGVHTWSGGDVRDLIQADQLHPTTLGLIALAQMTARALVDARLATEDDFAVAPDVVLTRAGAAPRRGVIGPPSSVTFPA